MTADIYDELRHLSGVADRLAVQLGELSQDRPPADGRRALAAIDLRRIIRARRLRDKYLGAGLFADPAWDMMLDLLAAKLECRRVGVTSLGLGAGVAATTALRWTNLLVERGLLVRIADPKDARRIFIELSPQAEAQLQAYFLSLQSVDDAL